MQPNVDLELLRVENSMLRTKLTQLEAKLDKHVNNMKANSAGGERLSDDGASSDGVPMSDMLVKIHQAKQEALKHSGGGGGSREQLSEFRGWMRVGGYRVIYGWVVGGDGGGRGRLCSCPSVIVLIHMGGAAPAGAGGPGGGRAGRGDVGDGDGEVPSWGLGVGLGS